MVYFKLSGVPQGSILGPLLFILYVNDLPAAAPGTSLFADDTTLLRASPNITGLMSNLANGIQRVITWMSSWRLSPNLSKTKIMLFPSQPDVPPLLYPLFPQPIDIVSSHKHLGIFIDSNLSWESHIDYIYKRSSSSLGILSSHCYHLPISCKLLFYSAYLRPIFDYADTAWAGISTTRAAKLEIHHKKVLKILLQNPACSHLPPFTPLLTLPLCLRDVIHILSPLSILSNSIRVHLTSTVSTGFLPVARETPFPSET